MKRSAFPFLLAAIIALVLGFSCQRDPSMDASAFETQFREAVQRGGFAVVNETSASQEEVPLPLTVQWHPRRWRAKISSEATSGGSDSADHFGLLRDRTSRVECFVRYLDGRAQFIIVRAAPKESLAATNLRTALAQQFPGFPIKVEIQ